jgi:tRNA 2-thiocytidine biosynthesis protein TtcA
LRVFGNKVIARTMHAKRLEQRILRAMIKANRDYRMIDQGDKVLVALSGGKDSYVMLWALMQLKASAEFEFDIVAYHLDQGQPGHNTSPIEEHLKNLGVAYEVEYQDTYTRVVEKTEPGKIYCSLCSRFRRAILYKAALRHGCNKVALGHHKDDIIETLLLNMFYAGQLKGMPPRLWSDKGNQEVIRPLCYIDESDLAALAQLHAYPILPCNLCGSQEAQRKYIKNLLQTLEQNNPHIKGNILHALSNVKPTHLMDKKLQPLYPQDAVSSEALPEDDNSCGDVSPSLPRASLGSLPVLNA